MPASLQDLIRLSELAVWGPDFWPYRLLHSNRSEDLRNLANGLLQTVQHESPAAANLAGIRKAAANDAINAISLHKVVDALRKRGIPIRCHVISEGVPRRFVWRRSARRFLGAGRLASEAPTITLLGPSDALVKKHWHRLPIGAYATLATYSFFIIKSITPSNQLSYVVHVAAEDQGILVTGDAGFVDFKQEQKRTYHPALLQALNPLHVVQVAHHGGNAAHFYRVLRDANYPQTDSFLLLSHATRDKHRPSREFREFAEYARLDPELIRVLFTTRPRQRHIRGFEELVHPSVGPTGDEGDIRLEYQDGTWQVTKHAIALTIATPPGGTAPYSVVLQRSITVSPPFRLITSDTRSS